MSNELIVFSRRSRRELGNPCINPPNGIRDIGAVNRYFMLDKKIFRDIGLDPLGEIDFFLDTPPPLSNLPDLMGGLNVHFTQSGANRKEEQKENEKFHGDNIKKIDERLSTRIK